MQPAEPFRKQVSSLKVSCWLLKTSFYFEKGKKKFIGLVKNVQFDTWSRLLFVGLVCEWISLILILNVCIF
jgi:hypothetical protein